MDDDVKDCSSNDVNATSTVQDDETTIVVRPTDVLSGKSKLIYNHPGNADFRQIISSTAAKYLTSKNSMERLCITETAIDQIESNNNGRFLRINHLTGNWILMTRTQVRDKVKNAFRDSGKRLYAATEVGSILAGNAAQKIKNNNNDKKNTNNNNNNNNHSKHRPYRKTVGKLKRGSSDESSD